MKTKKDGISLTALLIFGLILSFLIVLITDSARFFHPREEEEMLVEIRLENMDGAMAEALLSETEFSVDDSSPCRIASLTPPKPQLRTEQSRDGHILLLPSARLFTAPLTLSVTGRKSDEGFLAFGTRRWLAGGHVRLYGNRMTAEGLILSLTKKNADEEGAV